MAPADAGTGTTSRRERLDLDPERPQFLSNFLEPPPALPTKPRIGPAEGSSVLSSVRDFLAKASAQPPSTGAPGSSDPVIARASGPSSASEVRLPGVGEASEDEDEEAEEEADGPHVQMEVGLGVFDVNGSTDALLRNGVPEVAGRLPEVEGESSEESDEGSDEEEGVVPLIQELAGAGEGSGSDSSDEEEAKEAPGLELA